MFYKNILIFLLSLFLFGINNSFAQCKKMKQKRIHSLLGAAEYDNSRRTLINTFKNSYTEEYQINLFKGVVYKMIFDATKMPEGVVIKLVDLGKKRGPGKYEEIFNSETGKISKHGTYEVTMEFPQRKLMVIYDVINGTKSGCVSFILGYYFKNRIK